ncbi:carbohydrate kinase family protein [Microbacterium sp.]|uniref:carbohydrate kinase family protein n=1 Tax=Microbacterium sp. TaxID=51671 RepID=UPI003F70048F
MADAAPGVTGRLLVVGELCVDLIVGLTDDDIRFGQHEQLVPFTALTMGSSSAITACGAAAAGVPTTMIGVVGRDEFGDFILRELATRGLNVSRVRVDPSLATGSSTHLTRPDGDRAILTAMGTIGETAAADVPDAFDGAAHLHIGSWFLQRALWDDGPALFARARAAGLTTSIDGNFDPEERWDRGILDLVAHADVFFGNDEELAGITGLSDPDAAAASLLDRMPDGAVVVHKLGAEGAIAHRRLAGSTERVKARVPEVEGALVDTVGAGDSLAAGFLAGRLSGLAFDRSLALGVACGTASTRSAGGVAAQPSRRVAEDIAARVTLLPI